MIEKNNLVIQDNIIKDRIFTIRNIQVMVDRDLAEFYGIETKVFNQAVKRNIARFPEDFRFQLDITEKNELVTNCDRFKKLKHSSTNPYVFTEQGVSMLSAILKSDIAVKISIRIIREFINMREFISQNNQLFQKMNLLEQKQLDTDEMINKILDGLEDKKLSKKQGVFYNGEIFDAYLFVSNLIRKAKKSIVLIDNYIDETTLIHLSAKANSNVDITILTKVITKETKLDILKNNAQYTNIDIVLFKESHDRFLIIDEKVYHLGASIKDLGKKWFAFSELDSSSFIFIDKIKEIILKKT